ncbi:MAG: sulfatase-like hydrolase/transferase, partial [Phycisphaerae bacterium]|nr:sulfatase-like hydrolase/transferase [Phycisphaerae bacterium]
GGVGQASDYWGNDYYDDTYEHNGRFEKFQGYCTDVWFQGAINFIDKNRDEPFFCFIPTNAPHGPYRVPPQYAQPYKKAATWANGANFYGMIANLDENVGKLRAWLDRSGLSKNTLLIFMTDNGTANGAAFGRDRLNSLATKGFNAGMRGKKSSIYDGGHRVPCFFHWPGGGLAGGRDVPDLAAHIDLLPTLIDLCGLQAPKSVKFDGISLQPLLRGGARDWPKRTLIVQFQGGAYFKYQPEPWRDSVVMSSRWRLMDGKRLYDIRADPTQSRDVAAGHEGIVERMRAAYEAWWPQVRPRLYEPVRIGLGADAENPATLCSQDWYLPTGNPPWHPGSISKLPAVTGPWRVDVARRGVYEITLRQKPEIAHFPIVAKSARLRIADVDETKPVPAGATGVSFRVILPAGATALETFLTKETGKIGGAYFADVQFIGEAK